MTFRRALFGLVVLVAATFIATGSYANHGQFYVLDGFGGIHAGGGAPVISPGTPYFGFDIAKGIVYVPQGTGASVGDSVLVLDGFGGIHEGGALASDPVSPKTPYFGFDIARAITYRNIPPRMNFAITDGGNTNVTSATNVSIISTTLTLPDDGRVLIMCNTSMGNNSLTLDATARFSVGVDNLNSLGNIDHEVMLPVVQCSTGSCNWNTQSAIQVANVSAGPHTFHCLLRRIAGTGNVTYFDPAISAVYVDQDQVGLSEPASAFTGPAGGAIGQ